MIQLVNKRGETVMSLLFTALASRCPATNTCWELSKGITKMLVGENYQHWDFFFFSGTQGLFHYNDLFSH